MLDPAITLGGKEWPIPQLAVKQNRIIDPLLIRIIPSVGGDRSGLLGRLAPHYDALLEICYTALTRGNPELTRQQFDDLPVTLVEMMNAFNIIAQQTGIFVKEPPSGEAQGVTPPTGTPL